MRTYVVRLQEPRPGEDGEPHGVAEEIATGRQTRFASGSQLLEIFTPRGEEADELTTSSRTPT